MNPTRVPTSRFAGTEVRADGSPSSIQSIGPWELVAPLGEGAMCRVFLARPAVAAHNAPPAYAIKVLRRRWHDNQAAIGCLERDAEVGAAVSHANVVPVMAASVRSPPFYVVMPRLVGWTLAEAIASGWRPDLPVALWIARQITEGLAAIAGATDMLHGDVKPSNVFIGPNGHATLIDLGFARTRSESRAAPDRPILGTLGYAAPETLTSAYAADARSDMYSLGAALYEMLCGAPMFAMADAAELVRLQRETRPKCIRDRRPDLPRPIASLVHTLLCKTPERRPPTLRDLVARIARLEVEWFADRVA